MTEELEPKTRTQRFAEYVSRAALEAGYDIHSPRGGGRKALAEATGMSPSSVGRMLAGQTMPDAAQLEPLADALDVPLSELLVRSGIVTRGAMPAPAGPEGEAPELTPVEAANRLGIRSPERVHMFEAMVRTLLEGETTDQHRKAG